MSKLEDESIIKECFNLVISRPYFFTQVIVYINVCKDIKEEATYEGYRKSISDPRDLVTESEFNTIKKGIKTLSNN